ncbi:MAG: hypothetical protein K5875_07620 [Saccharofermentans sp.]|nr:hypothetical protein [Saccharofermentans sp.]
MTDITNTKIKSATKAKKVTVPLSTDFTELRTQASLQQMKGAPFMMASVVIWSLVTVIWMMPWELGMKNTLMTYAPALLIPLVLLFAKIIGAHVFRDIRNPFNRLGFLCVLNQNLYLLIMMWAYSNCPGAALMIFGMIFGAHLLPFSWVYNSKTYLVMSLVTTFGTTAVSIFLPAVYIPLFLALCQIVTSTCLLVECGNLKRSQKTKVEL